MSCGVSGFLKASVVFVAFAHNLNALGLDRATTLRGFPASCGDFLLNPPAPVTSFAVTEAVVNLAFSINGGRAGDIAAVTYITPAGQVYLPASGAWEPLTAAEAAMAHVCFFDQSLRIAGTQVASLPGQWSVRIAVNNAVLTTLTFTIGSGTVSCTYSLSATTGSAASGATSGSFNVIAGSGCAWTAQSNAPWLTITNGASGNGNGAVLWAVTANSGTASRTGTIMVTGAGQTYAFTLTQAGSTVVTPSGNNLIQNPGAEDGGVVSGCNSTAPVFPGWKTDGLVTVCPYGLDIGVSDPGPADRGRNYFRGGVSSAASMSQVIDVTANSSTIDAGVAYTLSGWLGGYDGQDDNAVVKATFRSASGGTLGTATIGPVLAGDRAGASGTVFRSTSATVPAGTRSVEILITYTRTSGSDNDGMADNLSFTLGSGSVTPACTYRLNPASATAGSTAATGSFQVTSGTGCTWMAAGSVSWLSVTGGSPGSGNGTVSYSVAANTGATSRTGTITVADQTFTLTQSGSTPAGGVVVTNKSAYLVREPILITWSGTPGNAKDWIAIAAATDPMSSYGQWFYLPGGSGTHTFDPVEPGVYEVRVFLNGGYDLFAKASFQVAYPKTTVTTDKTSYLITEKIGVSYANAPGWSGDWVAVSAVGSPDTSYLGWYYTNGAINGSQSFDPLATGQYEARVYYREEKVVRARSAPFTVRNPATTVTTDKSAYTTTDKIVVSYSNMPGYGGDWVALSKAGSADNEFGQWFYTVAKTSGTQIFDPLPAGQYEARAYYREEKIVRARSAVFSVGGSGCSVTISPSSASIAAGGGTGNITVTAGDQSCTWSAAASAGWTSITAGSSGKGSGSVSYSVTANTGTSSRTATITIGSQTFTITQAAPAPASCTYTLSVSGNVSLPGDGFSTSIAVTTQTNCPWTAVSSSPDWLNISNGSGSGSGSFRLDGTANPTVSPRTGTVTVADQSFTAVQKAGTPPAGAPAVTGVGNAASLTPATLASGGIAQGAIFSLTGTKLGPGDPLDPRTGTAAAGLPLAAGLGEVSVQVKQGSTTLTAYPVFAWTNRVDAIMPSNMPLGSVTITLTYKGTASLAVPATVVTSNFGAFSITGKSGGRAMLMVQASASDPGAQNSNTKTAKQGQIVTLIGTGLGAISGNDNSSPPVEDMAAPVEVLVAGKSAAAMHAGRVPGQPGKDRIQFQVPVDAPSDCNVPVQVVTGGTMYSNVVTMAIDANGQTCNSLNPWSNMAEKGGRQANVVLIRGEGIATKTGTPVLMDEGIAMFTNTPAGGMSVLNVLASIPALGTCGALAGKINTSTSLTSMPASLTLDAGPALTLNGPSGSADLVLGQNDDGSSTPGVYSKTLGGGLFGDKLPPPFLDPGNYTLSGFGGKDVGPFSANFTIPQPPAWTNRDDLKSIDRAAGVTFTWSGGSDSQYVMIAGGGADNNSQAATGFVCFVPGGLGSFTVPPSALANLPVTGADAKAGLLFGVTPSGAQYHFNAAGLDDGMIFYGLFQTKFVDMR